jgi:hypothetical protein
MNNIIKNNIMHKEQYEKFELKILELKDRL